MSRRLATPVLTACSLLAVAAGCANGNATAGAPTPSAATSAGAATTAPVPSASGASTAPSPSGTSSAPAASTPVDCKKLKCVALTYDDGPSELTPQLLKAFTSRHATATLFMLGNAAKSHPQIVKQAFDEGFEVANHTYDHKAISGLSDAQVTWEVRTTNAILKGITGAEPILMRPPYAARTKRTDKLVGQQGLAPVVWSNSPEDWLPGHDTAAVITKLTLQRTSRNAIILMHDIHPWTVAAAPAIIDALQKQGFTLVTVSQLLGTTTPGTLYPRS